MRLFTLHVQSPFEQIYLIIMGRERKNILTFHNVELMSPKEFNVSNLNVHASTSNSLTVGPVGLTCNSAVISTMLQYFGPNQSAL